LQERALTEKIMWLQDQLTQKNASSNTDTSMNLSGGSF
jgi:hypothetical protein